VNRGDRVLPKGQDLGGIASGFLDHLLQDRDCIGVRVHRAVGVMRYRSRPG
jgi:hypothetical protein